MKKNKALILFIMFALVIMFLSVLYGFYLMANAYAEPLTKEITIAWDNPTQPAGVVITGLELRINNQEPYITIPTINSPWIGAVPVVEGLNVVRARYTTQDGNTSDWSNEASWSVVCEIVINPPANLRVLPPIGDVSLLPQTEWELIYADSEELVGENGKAINAFDGNATTFWHTEWKNADAPQPHEIQIDLGDNYTITGFKYLPRQDGGENGNIKDYEFYISQDSAQWGNPVSSGSFDSGSAEKTVTFMPITGQCIRLKALSEQNNNPWTAIAEINILKENS